MAYIGASPSNGVRKVHTYTATAGQTTFSGASNENITLSYSDGTYVDVYQNGILLGTADYTATSGTSIVLAQAASLNDIVVITVYDIFSVADTVSKADGGTFDGNVTMGGTLDVTGATTLSSTLGVTGVATINGNVGIGATPDSNRDLHIKKTGANASILIEETTATNYGQFIELKDSSTSWFISNRYAATGSGSSGFGIGTTNSGDMLQIDTNGHVTMPSQSAFSAQPTSDINNITGDATTASLTNVDYTEYFDVNSDFNHNDGANRGKFTAPVTGKYYLGYTLCYSGITSASTSGVHALSTSNRVYNNNFNPYNHANVGVNGNIVFSAICDMDANDTAHVTLYVNGNGAKVVDILASQHKFFGMLIG